ncbi:MULTISPECIES: hypothetical protein [unclassified Streptomyces]|uniref:hypothetical protein n=1 Tax=unclassified Streptomyces TaxID=2593676 RepID=UPI002E353F8C|nr:MULTISPECIES: hypothetical protein [unclassified Streptomyces]
MNTPAPIEERLRAALEARGQLISSHDLSPARPPAGRTWGTRRVRRMLTIGTAVTAAAAAAAAFALLLSSTTPHRPHPAPPAQHSSPTPTPAPTGPAPLPSAVPSGP